MVLDISVSFANLNITRHGKCFFIPSFLLSALLELESFMSTFVDTNFTESQGSQLSFCKVTYKATFCIVVFVNLETCKLNLQLAPKSH